MNQRMERPTERVSPTGPRVLVLAGVLLSISLTDASWTDRCADHVTPGGGNASGEAADDLARALAAVRLQFGLGHDARAVPRFDGVAFLRQVEQLELLDVFPVRSLDGDRELLHRPIIACGCVRRARCGDKERQPTTKENRVRTSAPPTHPAARL